MSAYELAVYGRPAPQGSKRFVGMHGGHAVMVESSGAVRPWREAVKAAVLYDLAVTGPHQDWPLDGPLMVRMVFTMPKPKSAPKTRRTWPDRTPDLSKLIRSTEDALTDVGVIADDARIVDYERAAKVFPHEDPESLPIPGVRISVRRLLIPLEQ